MTRLFYLHGLESSPQGFRACYLRERFPTIIAPHFTKDVLERRAKLESEVSDRAETNDQVVLVGSSLGGMTALDFAVRNPQLVEGMVLLAPAVGFFNEEYRTRENLDFVKQLYVPAGIPALVIAGRNDEVIPLDAIRAMVDRSPQPSQIEMLVVEDEHSLRTPEALHAMINGVKRFWKPE